MPTNPETTPELAGVSSSPYRISDGPDGRRWWAPYEKLPPEYVFVRIANKAEAKLMERIISHRNPPLSWGDRIGRMIANN